MKQTLHLLDSHDITFPPVTQTLDNPEGLLAMGGNLETETLLSAYQQGIFPWFNHGEPILWWSPNPRMVILPDQLSISRSMRRFLKKHPYRVSFDTAFEEVMDACAEPRARQKETWITDDMKAAYCNLFEAGFAHSAEVWEGDELVGGLYGVAIDQIFFGESMFSRRSNTSKLAMIHLCDELVQRDFVLLDCQVPSEHLASLGARLMEKQDFIKVLHRYCRNRLSHANWKITGQGTANKNERTEGS